MPRRSRLLAWLAILLLLAMPAGAAPGPKAPASEALGLSLWYSLPAPQAAYLESLLAEYNASQPYVRVTGRNFPQPGALYAALLAGKEVPTLALMETSWLPGVAATGRLLKVETWMPREQFAFNWSIKANTYLPLWNAAHVGQDLVAMPMFFTTRALLYNPSIMAASGVKYPPATWDQLRQAARKATVLEKQQWGFYLPDLPPADLARNVQVFAWQAGGSLLGANGRPAWGAGVEKALGFLSQLVKTDHVAPPFPVPVEQVAMLPGSVEDYLRLRAQGVPLKTAALPGVERTQRTTELQAWALGMFTVDPAQLYKVREFAFWLLDFPQQRRWAETQPYLAAHVKVFDNPFYRREREADHQNLRVFLNVLGAARPVDTSGGAATALDGLGRALPPVLRGEKSAQEVFGATVGSVGAAPAQP